MAKWRAIPGFGGKYQISPSGQIKGRGGKVRSLKKGKSGYVQVHLYKDGKMTPTYVHRLMGAKGKGEVVNHKDGNKSNNSSSNLERISQKKNTHHARTTLGKSQKGAKGPGAKLSSGRVSSIRKQLRVSGGKGVRELARKYKMSPGAISMINTKTTW
jgi:hypothetical protein